MATSRTPLYGNRKTDVPEPAKCYICDLVTENLCTRTSDQHEHRQLNACMLYELCHLRKKYYLCERCREWLSDITYSLQVVQVARTFSDGDSVLGCFMCGAVVRLGIFTMNVRAVEKIVLDRFVMHYGSITKSMAMICNPCARTFWDLVRLHTMAGTEMKSKQITAAVPFYVDNYEDLLDLEVTPAPMQDPTTSSAHIEFKPCHHAIPPTPTTRQHFSIKEHKEASISSRTGTTEPSGVKVAASDEPHEEDASLRRAKSNEAVGSEESDDCFSVSTVELWPREPSPDEDFTDYQQPQCTGTYIEESSAELSSEKKLKVADKPEPYCISDIQFQNIIAQLERLMDEDDSSNQQPTETATNDHGCIEAVDNLEQSLAGKDARTASEKRESMSCKKEELTCDDHQLHES